MATSKFLHEVENDDDDDKNDTPVNVFKRLTCFKNKQ